MRDALVCREKGGGEGFGGVCAVELAGLGGWVEELLAGRWVHGEVVDALVCADAALVRVEGGLGEHGQHCFAVWFCQ